MSMYFPYLFHVETSCEMCWVTVGWCSAQLYPWRGDTDGHKAEFKTADLCLHVIVMVYLKSSKMTGQIHV